MYLVGDEHQSRDIFMLDKIPQEIEVFFCFEKYDFFI